MATKRERERERAEKESDRERPRIVAAWVKGLGLYQFL